MDGWYDLERCGVSESSLLESCWRGTGMGMSERRCVPSFSYRSMEIEGVVGISIRRVRG